MYREIAENLPLNILPLVVQFKESTDAGDVEFVQLPLASQGHLFSRSMAVVWRAKFHKKEKHWYYFQSPSQNPGYVICAVL